MGVIGANFITMRDLASGLKADGKLDHEIVELLAQNNEILDDIPWVQANSGPNNKTTMRVGLPAAIWRKAYQGVPASKSEKQQVVNASGQISTKLEIDKKLYDADPNKTAFLADEISSHMETMGNEVADAFFYGNLKDNAAKINGLNTFYDTVGSAGMDSKLPSHYVFNGAKAANPSGANRRSIWLINWGNRTMRGFYPQGSNAGISRSEFKTSDVTTTDGGTYEALRQYFYWDVGLDVMDFRAGGRIANIELDAMLLASGQPNYLELIDQLEARVKNPGNTKRVWYMSSLVFQNLRTLFGRATRGNAIEYKQVDQRMARTLFGYPVRTCDVLDTDEDAVA